MPGIIILPAMKRIKKMRKSLILAAAAMAAIGSVGCTSRPLQSVFHRGAPCGTTVTTPLMGDVTTYSPGCGMPDCPTCGTASGLPVMYGDGIFGEVLTDPSAMPGPGIAE